MSDRRKVLLLGATGLIGRQVVAAVSLSEKLRLVALARRQLEVPDGGMVEAVVATPADWFDAIASIQADAVICALGTTWAKAGRNEAAFRAVDHDLVLASARAARAAGAQSFVLISSVGAAMGSRSFYLRIKGEIEHNVKQLGFSRVDILRPGLLRGMRGSDRRLRERVGIALSPLTDRILQGPARKFRSLDAGLVARAALQFVQHDAEGDFVHVNDAIHRAARRQEASA